MRITVLIILMAGIVLPAMAQQENKLIRKGNNRYEDGNYEEAEVLYMKSQGTKDPTYKGIFNLGDVWYQQENYTQAAAAFDSVRQMNPGSEVDADTYYNLGNSLLKIAQDTANKEPKMLPASIESFKQSLRINPDDQDAKYNLAYAQNLLDQQQQQEQNQDQENQDDQQQDQQDQQQDQQEQNQDQQQEQEQEQNQQEQEQQQQEQQQQQPQQQISKEDAERMLEAMKNDEKQTMEKLQKVKAQAAKAKSSEKDW